jgi:tryptophanyl-tRNA synthetase
MDIPSGKRVLSAIQPTGIPHIGNYLGALTQWVALQNAGNRCTWFIADLHAITVPYDEKAYRTQVLTAAATLLASGIDPEKSTVFVQSHVPAHAEATWLLLSTARFGELGRMTQFKEKSATALGGKGKEGVSAGLFAYPVLQAADILLYKTGLVPVGEDQVQHLELSRVLARRFNSTHGPLFTEPQPYVLKGVARIMSLTDPTKKMSKTGDPSGCVFLTDTPDDMRTKVKSAVTDSGTAIDPKAIGPAFQNLLTIYGAFAGKAPDAVADEFAGKGYAAFKDALAELLIQKLTPIREKTQELLSGEEALLSTLQLGARSASGVATKTLRDMKDRMGFIQLP